MTNALHKAIPILDWTANAGSYRHVPVDASDPRAAELLVKLEDHGIAADNACARDDGNNSPYGQKISGALAHVWARASIARKLMAVDKMLEPLGLEIFVLDAYRPIACQQGLWDFYWGEARKKMPDASEAERASYVLNFVSDPTRFDPADSRTWPVHTSGGAVDVTLRRRETGEALDMGVGFDDMNDLVVSDAFERRCRAGEIGADDPRLINRRLLHNAMAAQGFINYPLEFWHFDYGDQMHALHARLLGHAAAPAAAWYGYADPPERAA